MIMDCSNSIKLIMKSYKLIFSQLMKKCSGRNSNPEHFDFCNARPGHIFTHLEKKSACMNSLSIKSIELKQFDIITYPSLEFHHMRFNLLNCIIYRPPPSAMIKSLQAYISTLVSTPFNVLFT